MYIHKDLLKPLKKPTLGHPVYFYEDDIILNTNIDGFPYMLVSLGYPNNHLQIGDKISFCESDEIYTIKNVDYHKCTVEAKMDKVFQLEPCEIGTLRAKLVSWGDKKDAEKLSPNYIFEFNRLVINGKLSKNQVVRFGNSLLKITELIKRNDGLIEIKGERIDFKYVMEIFPYKVDNVVKDWYYDIKDVWLRQAQEHLKEREK